MSADKIPDEILADIILRLPGKKIVQYRCLSKRWYSFLSDPFILNKPSIPTCNNSLILLVYENYDTTLCSLNPPSLELRPLNPPSSGPPIIIGSVDGLVCFTYYGVHIWNPFLGVSRAVPASPVPGTERGSPVSYGFAFDRDGEDYKIVEIKGGVYSSVYEVNIWLPVTVFSLREGSWKCIQARVPEHIKCIEDGCGVLVGDGCLYWLGKKFDHEKLSDVIVWYGLSTETFGEILVPKSRKGISLRLSELNGRLFLFSYTRREYCEVWVMDCGSWVKHHMLGSPFVETMNEPFRATWNGEFLFKTKGDSLVWFNPESLEVTKSGFREKYVSDVAPYVNSLVWFPPIDSTPMDSESGVSWS